MMEQATSTTPCQVKTSVKPATRNGFARAARNWRLTRSRRPGTALSLTAVFTGLPHTTPCSPIRRRRRATGQRAATMPTRLRGSQTLPTPIAPAVLHPDPTNRLAQNLIALYPYR